MEQAIDTEEWADWELGRAIALGALVGLPVLFLMLVVLGVVTDLALWKAVGVAAVPAVVVGPYIGGLFAVGATAAHHEH